MLATRRLGSIGLAWLLSAGAACADTMPQLDFADRQNGHLLIGQVIWGALIFVVFYLLVSRWGLPRVGAILQMRAGTIAADLERAHHSKVEADRAVSELTAARKAAYAQSQAAVATATQNAKAEAAARTAEQEARLDAQLADSEAQIARARTAAMGALRQVAAETAALLIGRLTGARADEAQVQDAVDRILSERGHPA